MGTRNAFLDIANETEKMIDLMQETIKQHTKAMMINTYQKVVLISGTLLTFIAAGILSLNSSTQATVMNSNSPGQLTPVKFDSIHELRGYFRSQNFLWPLSSTTNIPPAAIQNIPPDLNELGDIKLRKTIFIRIMLPIIYAEQERIRNIRQTLIDKLNRTGSNASNHQWFKQLLADYKISETDFITQRRELLKHVDELPTALVLAQAAIESGWGTSRFAIEGNSLFGQWTFAKGDGLAPLDRQEGKNHQVKSFESLQASVRSYFRNINRNKAYRELREYRYLMRENAEELDPYKLAEGLHRYSQKGRAYVDAIHNIMDSTEFQLIKELEKQEA